MQIPWEQLDPRKFEDLVSVLLSRLNPESQRIDGTGGDGGRDVQIVHGLEGRINNAFELKSFTGRMTPSRRAQTARSLERAATLEPERWSLVVPIDPTPGEDRWFRQLGSGYGFPIEWLGRTWLDEKMAAFPDIRRYFLEGAKDEVFNLLRELREEQARVADVHDAVKRLETLHARLNEIDPYYSYYLSTGPTAASFRPEDVALSISFGDVRIDVYPKYSGAHEDRPITVNVKFLLDPGDDTVKNALSFGMEATIPPSMVSSLVVDAPAGLGGSFTGGEISLLSSLKALKEPLLLSVDIKDEDRLLASWPIRLTERSTGFKGSILTGADSTGWLQARLRADIEARQIEVKLWLEPKTAMPSALVPFFRWLAVCQPPNCLSLRGAGVSTTSTEIQAPLGNESFGRIVEAFAYLQDHVGVHWEISPFLSPEEGQELLTAVTLLKGERIDFTWTSLNLSLDDCGPALEELLDGNPRSFRIDNDMWLELEDVKLPIGLVRTQIESACLANIEAVRQGLTSGLVSVLCLMPGSSDRAHRVLVQ